MTRGIAFCSLIAIAIISGCGDRIKLYELSGTVMYKGQPLPAGQIFFDPDYTKGNDGPPGCANIKDGRFDTKNQGRGVMGGPYKIRIDGFDGKPGNELPLGKPLFSSFTIERVLPKENSIQSFEVTGK